MAPISQINTEKKKKIDDFIPFKPWDLNTNTKFVQFLNVPNIERLYQKINLINLDKLNESDYYYVKGVLDTLYALIGVDTPIKRVIDKDLKDMVDDRLQTYIAAITSQLNSSRVTRKATEKERKEQKESGEDLPKQLMQHILNQAERNDEPEE